MASRFADLVQRVLDYWAGTGHPGGKGPWAGDGWKDKLTERDWQALWLDHQVDMWQERQPFTRFPHDDRECFQRPWPIAQCHQIHPDPSEEQDEEQDLSP